jgi:hypothetical protein
MKKTVNIHMNHVSFTSEKQVCDTEGAFAGEEQELLSFSDTLMLKLLVPM